MKFTFGSDPEFLLVRDGQYYSAIGIVPGTKENRFKQKGHQYYYDNVLAECAIAPAKTKKETLEHFQECFQQYARLVNPYKLIPQASVTYPASELLHEDAREVGCKEEFCAYKVMVIENVSAEKIIKKTNFRSAGGHIHLGSKLFSKSFAVVSVVRMLDLFLGIPSLYLDHDITSPARKKIYGKAGWHRIPAYGVEYRTLGNFWLASPKLVSIIYDLCEFVLDFVDQDKHLKFWTIDDDVFEREDWYNAHHCIGYNVKDLKKAINKSDMVLADSFMTLIEHYLPVGLFKDIKNAHYCYDFYTEWRL